MDGSAYERPSAVPPPPRPKRFALQRMPTELILTTRMPAVRLPASQSSKRASGVINRPQQPADPHVAPPTDSRPVRPQTAAPLPAAPPERVEPVAAGAPTRGTDQHRRYEQQRPRPTAHGGKDRAAASRGTHEVLYHVQTELVSALERAHRSEERAAAAEMRALWAERFIPVHYDPADERRAQQHAARMNLLKSVLQAGLVGLAIGGYLSLLLPVRERVLAQESVIRELGEVQQQLRHEKEALLLRLEALGAGRSASRGAAPDAPDSADSD